MVRPSFGLRPAIPFGIDTQGLGLPNRVPAVDDEIGACDECGGVGCQVQDGLSHIDRLAEPAHRRHCKEVSPHPGVRDPSLVISVPMQPGETELTRTGDDEVQSSGQRRRRNGPGGPSSHDYWPSAYIRSRHIFTQSGYASTALSGPAPVRLDTWRPLERDGASERHA